MHESKKKKKLFLTQNAKKIEKSRSGFCFLLFLYMKNLKRNLLRENRDLGKKICAQK